MKSASLSSEGDSSAQILFLRGSTASSVCGSQFSVEPSAALVGIVALSSGCFCFKCSSKSKIVPSIYTRGLASVRLTFNRDELVLQSQLMNRVR
jgi:hypothetical protein